MQPKPFRLWNSPALAKTFLLVFGLLLICEMGLRVYTPMETFNGWHNHSLYNKIQAANLSAQDSRNSWDVLFLGSSVGLALSPTRFREIPELQNKSMFNACVGGQRPDVLRLMFEGVFWPLGHPNSLIFIITPNDINAGTATEYQSVSFCKVPRVEVLNTDLSLIRRLPAWLEIHSRLFAVRRHLRGWLSHGVRPEEIPQQYLQDGSILSPLSGNEFLPETVRYLKNFSIQNSQIDEIVRLSEFCMKNQIDFTVVSQPLPERIFTQSLSAKETAKAVRSYEEAISKLNARLNKPVVMLDTQTTYPNELAFDPLHANRWGADMLMSMYWQKVLKPANCTAEFPKETGFRFSKLDLGQHPDLMFSPSGIPWSTKGIRSVDRKAGASVNLDGQFAPGSYVVAAQLRSEKTPAASIGNGNDTTVSLRLAEDKTLRDNRIATASLVLNTTSALCLAFFDDTAVDNVFIRQTGTVPRIGELTDHDSADTH